MAGALSQGILAYQRRRSHGWLLGRFLANVRILSLYAQDLILDGVEALALCK